MARREWVMILAHSSWSRISNFLYLRPDSCVNFFSKIKSKRSKTTAVLLILYVCICLHFDIHTHWGVLFPPCSAHTLAYGIKSPHIQKSYNFHCCIEPSDRLHDVFADKWKFATWTGHISKAVQKPTSYETGRFTSDFSASCDSTFRITSSQRIVRGWIVREIPNRSSLRIAVVSYCYLTTLKISTTEKSNSYRADISHCCSAGFYKFW